MPRSPSTRVRRTFVGETQSTLHPNVTPLASRPVTSTRSSCSRSITWAVWAASEATGERPSQRTRSRSCVPRSLTTPTSLMRSGNGPTRSVRIRSTSPSSSSRRRSSMRAGLNRSTWPTPARTPACWTTSITSRASAAVAASGFSTSMWAPRAATARTPSRWNSSAPRRSRNPAPGHRPARRRPSRDRGPRRSGRRRDRQRRRTQPRGRPAAGARGAGRSSPAQALRRAALVSGSRRSRPS